MTNGGKQFASTQAYLPISEIKEGVVVMKDHSLRAVIIASSLNFALKSEQEKDAIVVSYQSFLNSLSFPIQIVASSRKLDLTKYINGVRSLSESQENPLLKIQTEEYAACWAACSGVITSFLNLNSAKFAPIFGCHDWLV